MKMITPSDSTKTNPIQSQYKPNLLNAQMNANAFSQKDYENETAFRPQKNKPNSNPTCSELACPELACGERGRTVEPISNPTTDSTVLIKLWYWIMNNKLNVLKELKQLQLQIAELAAKKKPTEA